MVQPHRIQTIGIVEEAIENTDPIVDTDDPYYQLGLYNVSWGKFPQLKQNILPSYRGGAYDPYHLQVSRTEILGQITNIPTNGFMYNFALGNASSADGLHTISGINTGKNAPFTTRFESHDGTVSHGFAKVITGGRIQSYSTSIDLTQPDMVMSSVFNFKARQMAPSNVQTQYAPVYADLDTEISQEPYKVDSNFEVLWDVGGDDVDLSNYMRGFTYTLDTFNRFWHIKDYRYPRAIIQGNRSQSISFSIDRTDETSVFDDFLNQRTTDDFKDMSFKIYNTATDYLKHNFTEVAIINCDSNHAMIEQEQEPTYEIIAVVKSNQIQVKDGVAPALYGVV